MPEHPVKAGAVDKAEEVLDVVFPSGDDSTEAVHPGEESLHLPTFSVSAQPAPVPAPVPVAPVGRDHLDAEFLLEPSVEINSPPPGEVRLVIM